MADVAMAEVPAAGPSTMTRREHLLQTFEAYRAELDADVRRSLPHVKADDRMKGVKG